MTFRNVKKIYKFNLLFKSTVSGFCILCAYWMNFEPPGKTTKVERRAVNFFTLLLQLTE